MNEQRYQIREDREDKTRPWKIVDTWENDRVMSSSPYSGEITRKLYSLRNRVGNGGIYSRG